jgi:1-pyrroline-5-carboxylate dehydrogenase
MSNSSPSIPLPVNEPVRNYAPGSPERASLKARLDEMYNAKPVEIPCVIGGKRVKTGKTIEVVCPHDHQHVLAIVHCAGPKETEAAIAASAKAYGEWSRMPWDQRAAILLRAADLLALNGKNGWRDILNGATMLGQSKSVYQAEIDAACELIDFWRFNAYYCNEIYAQQPPALSPGIWNQLEQRPLEGFVFAVSPFNFTAIGGNLPTAPALMGNTVVWKPAEQQSYSAWFTYLLLEEAGLPPGVINFIPGPGAPIGATALASRDLAGIHFTGSTGVFQKMWAGVGENIAKYRSYPRIVGETGGKDFVLAHSSADVDVTAAALVRGAFEYQGQKCSAASRAYIPKSLWPKVRKSMLGMLETIKIGDTRDFSCFMNAVIDKTAFEKITGYIKAAKKSSAVSIEFGGGFSDKTGYFIEPTVLLTENPQYRTMCEEIFGPVLTLHVYNDKDWSSTLELVNNTSPYALTGAVIANERTAIVEAREALVQAAGNFYINDKPTGAVVGQQPFGGARASGTNDKAGAPINLLRWVSPRTVKENFVPPRDYRYPFLADE